MSSGRPFAKGYDPRRGVGLKGRAGRKPNRWKACIYDILMDPEVQDGLRAAVRDRHTPGYASLLRLLASYAEGQPIPAQQDPLNRLAVRIAGMSEGELDRLQQAPQDVILRLIAECEQASE